MSTCGEPCDSCTHRATHHLCDECCEADINRLKEELAEAKQPLVDVMTAWDEVNRLRGVLEDFAEYDCEYGDNCPSNAGTRHGTCVGCKARQALEKKP